MDKLKYNKLKKQELGNLFNPLTVGEGGHLTILNNLYFACICHKNMFYLGPVRSRDLMYIKTNK